MAASVAALLGGIAILAWASDQFVIGAARLAVIRRVPPIVVGAVIVGFGTSSPELLVSAFAAIGHQPEIAVGNIVGSNLVNLSLILGIGAFILPLSISSRTVRREAPLTVGAMVLFALLVRDGLGALDGVVLLLTIAFILVLLLRSPSSDPLGDEAVELVGSGDRLSPEILRTLLGLVGTVGGAQILLWGAVGLADRAGLAAGFVGATLVAVGTSLPELVTVVQSARRREPDLIVGNLLGSNLFNALAVGGATGLLGPGSLDAPRLSGFGSWTAAGLGLLVAMMMITGRRVSRLEGLVLVGLYLALVPLLG